MKYKLYAYRTASDNKLVLVGERNYPYTESDIAYFKEKLTFNSLEFNLGTKLIISE